MEAELAPPPAPEHGSIKAGERSPGVTPSEALEWTGSTPAGRS